MKDYSDITVITPTFNEEKNIGKLVKMITGMYENINIIVADDGSKDKTQEVVRKLANGNHRVKLIDRSKRSPKGLTASVLDGMEVSKTRFSIVIDADLQHPPEKIKDVAEMLHSGSDIVVATRRKVHVYWPWYRKLMSKSATLAGDLRLLFTGTYSKDIMSGFFGIRTDLAQKIIKRKRNSFQLQGYKVLFDLLKNVKGVELKEVPYDFGLRSKGESKMNSKVVYYYFRSLFS